LKGHFSGFGKVSFLILLQQTTKRGPICIFLEKSSKEIPKKLFYLVKHGEKLDKRKIFLYNQIVKFSNAEK
jgi:hypothetical protein